MRDIQTRWTALFEKSIGVDLREAVRAGDGWDPGEAGLRSVCWKAFLLYGPISQASWPKKLAEGRQAYSSLRDHFLRFIDHPDDIHSADDPLADDESSPWSTLRNDEAIREEIFQDVARCMQDNFFFREPSTQKKLLDILFIYSKLNPDTGYRQGMHELLAPLLWVVNQDAIDHATFPLADTKNEGFDLMMDALDRKYVEHDAFNLFCAVMQTTKAFYEVGENKDSSAIVSHSKRIHEELLATFDPELALHLQVVGVLPQIYAIRWIRLLFGREFEFKDVLRVWDILFAENLRTDIIDMTCVAMLLRIRWTLVEADYSSAITSLSRFGLPNRDDDPRSLLRDAIYLDENKILEAGVNLIQQYSGRKPKSQKAERSGAARLRAAETPVKGSRSPQHKPSPSASPARFTTPQKQLETLFQQVSEGIQQRTEGWNVSKAVRGAVGEVRRNVNNFQTSHSRHSSVDIVSAGDETPRHDKAERNSRVKQLETQVQDLQARNRALSRMLDGVMESLRASRSSASESPNGNDEAFNISLAKIQFVSVYLADSDIPIPLEDVSSKTGAVQKEEGSRISKPQDVASRESEPPLSSKVGTIPKSPAPNVDEQKTVSKHVKQLSPAPDIGKASPPTRPSLAESSFSFMLGENRHRSSFRQLGGGSS